MVAKSNLLCMVRSWQSSHCQCVEPVLHLTALCIVLIQRNRIHCESVIASFLSFYGEVLLGSDTSEMRRPTLQTELGLKALQEIDGNTCRCVYSGAHFCR